MELWCPFAIRRDGPPQKLGAGGALASPKRGEVKHSAEGYWDGIYQVLDDLRTSSSWHFTVGDDRLEQHYPLDANCWHANDTDADGLVRSNFALVGVEHLGVAGVDLTLTPRQVTRTEDLTRWMALQFGRSAFGRYPAQLGVWTMAEHTQVGNDPTACPSGRIPWETIMADLNAFPRFAYGDQALGCELRTGQHIFWVNGVEVVSIGDPEFQGVGRLAKNYGPVDGFEVGDVWFWLRKGDDDRAYWSREEGD
jgi:N-acetylmuramoyl-L-alanine amidase-like protein